MNRDTLSIALDARPSIGRAVLTQEDRLDEQDPDRKAELARVRRAMQPLIEKRTQQGLVPDEQARLRELAEEERKLLGH